MVEEVAKIKANKDGTYIDIVPEKCVSAQNAQYDENGRDLLDAESSQTIKGANTFAAKQTFTGGVAVSGTSAIAGNVNMDSGDLAIGAKVTASNTGNAIKVANHDSVLTSNDVLSAKDINTPNGDANNLVHRTGINGESVTIPLTVDRNGSYFGENMLYFQSHGNADGTFPSVERHGLMVRHSSDSGSTANFQARLFILFNTDGSGELRFDVSKKWSDGTSSYKSKTLAKFTAEGVIS